MHLPVAAYLGHHARAKSVCFYYSMYLPPRPPKKKPFGQEYMHNF